MFSAYYFSEEIKGLQVEVVVNLEKGWTKGNVSRGGGQSRKRKK